MSETIWKQTLKPKSAQEVMMPRGARILSAQAQDNLPTIWFQCDPDEPMEWRNIHIVGTDHEPPANAKFIGTVQLSGGSLVVHIFERAQ